MACQFKIDWRNPDYTEVYEYRADLLNGIRSDSTGGVLKQLKLFYADNPVQFMIDWGVTFDPRNAFKRDHTGKRLATKFPFIPFDKQEELLYWLLDRMNNREDGLIEKSRDEGVSWLVVGLGATLCIFIDGFKVGYGSRKEDYVDKLGDPKSLFWKAREFVDYLPEEFRAGWVRGKTDPFMRMLFPDTGSAMTGEAGSGIGRGDRCSVYFVDEAQPLDAKIMTPSGWKLMGNITVGDSVIGQKGKPVKVTHINECGLQQIYHVAFSDGTHTECSEHHLWKVQKVYGNRKTEATLRTDELLGNYVYHSPGGQTQFRYRIPTCSPVEFNKSSKPLPLHPYLLGALLGDGSVGSRSLKITTADAEIVQAFRDLLPDGVKVGAYDGRYSYNICDAVGRKRKGRYLESRAVTLVKQAGIFGLVSHTKYIPVDYLHASPTDRLEVLRGLMDTDGSASKTSGCESFYTSSSRLADDVTFLVQSLGGTVWLKIKPDARGYLDQYALQIALPDNVVPFRLARKADRLQFRKHPLGRTIVNIKPVGKKQARCITVEAEDGLYLTDSFIVTHNSAHLEQPEAVDMSLASTADTRIDLSSVNGRANPFAIKRFSGKLPVFTLHWKDDPRKDQVWYDAQCEKFDPIVVAQEIDIDYMASVENVIIPGAWAIAAVDAHTRLGLKVTGDRFGAFDVGDQGDKCAFCVGHGILIENVDEWTGKGSDIFNSVQTVFNLCDEYGLKSFVYDEDGLGASVKGDARIINLKRTNSDGADGPHRNPDAFIKAIPFRGSAAVVDPEKKFETTDRTNEDYFANLKAQSWFSLRTRFRNTYRWVMENKPCDPSKIISIAPNCKNRDRLIIELSQPTYLMNGAGKMLIDKVPEGATSPNLGDSTMMRYSPIRQNTIKITGAMMMKMQQRRRT